MKNALSCQVAHACNPCTQERKVGGHKVQGHHQTKLQEILPQKQFFL